MPESGASKEEADMAVPIAYRTTKRRQPPLLLSDYQIVEAVAEGLVLVKQS